MRNVKAMSFLLNNYMFVYFKEIIMFTEISEESYSIGTQQNW